MELSIIIVNFNVSELLVRCIKSIYANLKIKTFEIIVVDNNSGDQSCEIINSLFPEVVLIRNSHNAWFSGANNQGICKARGRYILLLNPDTYLIDSSLIKMFEFIKEQNDQIVLASPMILNTDMTIQHSAWKDKKLMDLILEICFLDRIWPKHYPLKTYNYPITVDSTAGSAMIFSKETINKIGNFDLNLYWKEDIDLCTRIRKAGGKVFYFPAAKIVHCSYKSASQNRNEAYAKANISKILFVTKNNPSLSISLAWTIVLAGIFVRIFVFALPGLLSIKMRKQLNAYLYTLSQLIKFIRNPKLFQHIR